MSRKTWLAITSGIFITVCFPNFSVGFLAWVALIPFLISLHHCTTHRQALSMGFVAGLVFFIATFYWLNYVVTFGWIFIALIESSFFMLFGWVVYLGRNFRQAWFKIFWIASAWTVVEILRSELPLFGLGWNLLAYSQTNYPWILQSANVFGAYGLGFLIVFVNACLFQIMMQVRGPKKDNKKNHSFRYAPRIALWFAAIVIPLLLIGYGWTQLQSAKDPERSIRVSVIQGNIPQDIKWEPDARDEILQIYTKLTELAALDQPDLIIWPEASFPGYLTRDYYGETIFELIRKLGIASLIGSPHWVDRKEVYNSAYLLDSNAEIQARYDKINLVPFGEYVPIKPVFGWLEPLAYSLGVGDFSAGDEFTVFRLENFVPFATLICFEDVFPSLARQFVGQGARFLTVITNDAWFGPTTAPFQHLQASIFRAVENGVPVVRAANTGVSAFITKRGEVIDQVERDGNQIFVTGKKTATIGVDQTASLYQKGGYIIPYIAFFILGIMALVRRRLE